MAVFTVTFFCHLHLFLSLSSFLSLSPPLFLSLQPSLPPSLSPSPPLSLRTEWSSIGLSICYDLRFPKLAHLYALQGESGVTIAG